jgi:hypothetical protein
MEGALEAHRGGDAGKGLAVDGRWRTSAEKTGDAGPENKQEKTENNKEPTKQGKSRKGAQIR